MKDKKNRTRVRNGNVYFHGGMVGKKVANRGCRHPIGLLQRSLLLLARASIARGLGYCCGRGRGGGLDLATDILTSLEGVGDGRSGGLLLIALLHVLVLALDLELPIATVYVARLRETTVARRGVSDVVELEVLEILAQLRKAVLVAVRLRFLDARRQFNLGRPVALALHLGLRASTKQNKTYKTESIPPWP